jgi:hypothetical protein
MIPPRNSNSYMEIYKVNSILKICDIAYELSNLGSIALEIILRKSLHKPVIYITIFMSFIPCSI